MMPTPHKILARVALALLMLALLAVATAAPAEAMGVRTGPVDELNVNNWSGEISNYLIVNRWSPVTFSPTGFLGFGAVTTYGPYIIQSILLSFTVFVVRVLMIVVTLTSGGDLVSSVADTIDEVFAKIGNGVLGNDQGELLSGQGALIVTVLLLVMLGLSAWRLIRGGPRAFIQTLGGGLAALALLAVMSSGAASNVRNQDTYADSPRSAPGAAVMSPKWFITAGNGVSAWLGDQTQSIFSAMSDSLDQDQDSARDECERYIAAIHETYKVNSGAETSANVVTAFDALMVAVLYDNVRVASMGGSTPSADSAWCRYSEMDASVPMIDQVQVSRTAGLYSDIVGYDPAIAVDGSQSRRDGTAITASGEWTEDGQELATSIFGPAFGSGDASARAQYFWAACQWDGVGQGVSLNRAWADVKASAASSNDWWENFTSNASPIPLLAGIGIISDIFSGGDHPGNLGEIGDGDDVCRAVVNNGLTADDKEGARAFQYGESYFLVDTLRPWNLSAAEFFEGPVAGGDTEAHSFYRATQGLDTDSTVVGGLAAVVAAALFVKFAAPVSVGLLAAQVIGIIAWMLLPLALLGLIVPTNHTKRAGSMAWRTIVFSLLASVLFQMVLQLALFTYSLVIAVLDPEEGDALTRWALTTLAAVLAFFMVRQLVKAVFSQDLTTMKGALRASTQIANRPLMSERGDVDDNYGFRRHGRMSNAARHMGSELAYAGRSRLADRARKGGAGSNKSDDPTLSKSAAAATGQQQKPAAGTPGGKKGGDWRAAAGTAGSAALGSAGARPSGTPQARGAYKVNPNDGTFTIPKHGTVSAAGEMTPGSETKDSVSQQDYSRLSASDRAAYTFDPVSGRMVPKSNLTGVSPSGLSKSVVAPLSALSQQQAPEGVAQGDWDKTQQMRAQIADAGMLDNVGSERRAQIDSAAHGSREQAAALGTPLPAAPHSETLAAQAPGVLSQDGPPARAGGTNHPRTNISMKDQAATVAGSLGSLDPARREGIARQAATAVLDDPDHFAAVTNSQSERVSSAARQVLEGKYNAAMVQQLVEMVNDNGRTDSVEDMRAMMVEAGQQSGMVQRSLSSGPVLANLDAAQQQVLAQEAARLVLSESQQFAQASSMRREDIARAAQEVLDGNASMDDSESIVRMVREMGAGAQAHRLQAVMNSVSSSGGALPAMEHDMSDAMEHVARIADEQRNERTVAIRDRFRRDLSQMQATADEQMRAINSALAEQMSQAGPTATMSEADFSAQLVQMQREAVVRKSEIEARLASQMSGTLDSIGVELSKASVPDESLDHLRATRQSLLSNAERVKGVRGWFQR
jgi:hypothetical protein